MNVFLVGGAVRDSLLNRPIKDNDWVVVGSSTQSMLDQGYQQVGNDFPVFLHPVSGEEYALARTERKTGSGYGGFECYAGTDVSLEDDLSRRDLTINAMAQSEDGDIIDPYGGQTDLTNRILRHVSDAFTEDPLRVLRVARFLARYQHLGFTIASDTLQLMTHISHSGELEALTVERVWAETEKALLEPSPRAYFDTLKTCGALAALFPDLDALFDTPQTSPLPQISNAGEHSLYSLDQAVLQGQRSSTPESADHSTLAIRLSALTHGLGKGKTPTEELPAHHGYEPVSEFLTKTLCTHYKVPSHATRIAVLVARYHTQCHRAFELKPSTLMRLLESLDVLRRPETLSLFLSSCEAIAQGAHPQDATGYAQADYLQDAADIITKIDPQSLIRLGFVGAALGNELRERRIRMLKELKATYTQTT